MLPGAACSATSTRSPACRPKPACPSRLALRTTCFMLPWPSSTACCVSTCPVRLQLTYDDFNLRCERLQERLLMGRQMFKGITCDADQPQQEADRRQALNEVLVQTVL